MKSIGSKDARLELLFFCDDGCVVGNTAVVWPVLEKEGRIVEHIPSFVIHWLVVAFYAAIAWVAVCILFNMDYEDEFHGDREVRLHHLGKRYEVAVWVVALIIGCVIY